MNYLKVSLVTEINSYFSSCSSEEEEDEMEALKPDITAWKTSLTVVVLANRGRPNTSQPLPWGTQPAQLSSNCPIGRPMKDGFDPLYICTTFTKAAFYKIITTPGVECCFHWVTALLDQKKEEMGDSIIQLTTTSDLLFEILYSMLCFFECEGNVELQSLEAIFPQCCEVCFCTGVKYL